MLAFDAIQARQALALMLRASDHTVTWKMPFHFAQPEMLSV
jgi:hypothetical protein